MSIVGEGTISMKDTSGTGFNTSYRNAAISVGGGTLTLGEGVVVSCVSGDGTNTAMSYAVDVLPQADTVVNINGASLHSSYIGVRLWALNAGKTGTVNFNSGSIVGDKKGYDMWVQGMDQNGTPAVNIAEGISYTTEDISGIIYLFD